MKIVGVTRVRNEEEIFENTLNHVASIVDEIYVFDDCSTDNTVKIAKSNKKVKMVIEAKRWNPNPIYRQRLEGTQRQSVYLQCLKSEPDWVYYFDADEYADFTGIDFNTKEFDGYRMRFFDYYITPEDVHKKYYERKFIGPEYRDILTLFKPNKEIYFPTRVPYGTQRVTNGGFVKHYGKAISIEEWEKTCDYYINHLFEPQPVKGTISKKWQERKGKAIHNGFSDFGRALITWEEINDPRKIIDNSLGQAE